MTFYEEPTSYYKTALSDLQGAWQNLRETVVDAWPFPECDRLLVHIDEGMSWESVRNLDNMQKTLLLVHNIAAKPPENLLCHAGSRVHPVKEFWWGRDCPHSQFRI